MQAWGKGSIIVQDARQLGIVVVSVSLSIGRRGIKMASSMILLWKRFLVSQLIWEDEESKWKAREAERMGYIVRNI